MPRPITQVYRYHLRVNGDPGVVDLWLYDEEFTDPFLLVMRSIPRTIGLALTALLNGADIKDVEQIAKGT